MNVEALLLAIAMVESGNDPSAIGKKMERTEYQILPTVWHKYSPKIPMHQAQPWMAKVIAKKHIESIRKSLPADLASSPFWVAAQWNGGIRTVKRSKYVAAHVPRGTRDYADRVRALYHVYEKSAACNRHNKWVQ